MSNLDIRQAIRASGLYAYEVADLLGMTETSFSRLMRRELSPERKQQILSVIKRSLKDAEQ